MLSIIRHSFLLFIFSLLPKFGFIGVLSGGMGEGRGRTKGLLFRNLREMICLSKRSLGFPMGEDIAFLSLDRQSVRRHNIMNRDCGHSWVFSEPEAVLHYQHHNGEKH